MSQTVLARELGIARTYLSQIENDKVRPGLSLLKSISHRFCIPVALLLIDGAEPSNEIQLELRKLLGDLLTARLALKEG
ncbi:MAG: helix-turn-helix transcriptional regulator [candidate division Zixibacteria bacterium]|nr:helix-turn-helix transcriptional regulator [candidate division Zixibacteria bacterium]